MQVKLSFSDQGSEWQDQRCIEAVCLNRVIFTLIVFQIATVVEMMTAGMKLSESVILECKYMPILCIKSTQQSYLCICLLTSQHACCFELEFSLFDFLVLYLNGKLRTECKIFYTVKERAMVNKDVQLITEVKYFGLVNKYI